MVTWKHSFQTLQVKPSRPCNLGNTANTFKRFKIYFFSFDTICWHLCQLMLQSHCYCASFILQWSRCGAARTLKFTGIMRDHSACWQHNRYTLELIFHCDIELVLGTSWRRDLLVPCSHPSGEENLLSAECPILKRSSNSNTMTKHWHIYCNLSRKWRSISCKCIRYSITGMCLLCYLGNL